MVEKNQEIFKHVLKQIPEGVIIADDNNKIIFVNSSAERVRHISKEKLLGKSVLNCHSKKTQDKVSRAIHYLQHSNKNSFSRMVTDKVLGKFYDNTYASILDDNNNFIGTVVISRDITEKRQLEEARAQHLLNLEERVSDLTIKYQNLFISSMLSLMNALEAKDSYTKGHSIRVSEISTKIVEYKYGISPESKTIELAGKLHDIGKVGVPESILNKPAKLNNDEFNHVKRHPNIGEEILRPVFNSRQVLDIVRHHHERFDGNGYPDGLSGDEIPLGARIIAIVDAFDALTSDRPYRSAVDYKKSLEEINRNAGTQFDPEWVDIFLKLVHSGSIG